MAAIEIWSVASSIVSVILAVFAVALSVWFFKESVRYAQEGTRAAESISASVKKLEALFDRLYADTFSMMRDTYTDMRKHVWPSPEEQDVADEEQSAIQESIDALKESVLTSMAEIIKKQTRSEEDISQIKTQITTKESAALNEAITNTVEAIESPATPASSVARARRLIRMFMTREKKLGRTAIEANDIWQKMASYDLKFSDFEAAMEALKEKSILRWEGLLGPSTMVT